MSRQTWRLRGLHKSWVLIHTRDLRAGEESVRFTGSLIPDVFDPGDPFSVYEALGLCGVLAAHLQCSPSVRELRAYLEDHIQRALEHGEIVMISGEAPVYNIHVAGPQKRGIGIAWRVDVSTNKFWVARREHILPGDTVVQVGEVEKIIDGLLRTAGSGKLVEIRELLNITTDGLPKYRSDYDTRVLRSRLELAFHSGAIVVVREKAASGAGGASTASRGLTVESGMTAAARTRSTIFTPPPKAKATHWIEIKLVGEDGKPIPLEDYRIQLPDGKLAEGRLDKNGSARVDGIPTKGNCQVTFPNLDREAWDRA